MSWPKLNHRQRLTGLLTVSVSLALALVFAVVLAVLRQQATSRRFSDLRSSVSRVAQEWTGPESLREEKEDFPGSEFSVFRADGRALASTGKNAPPFVNGERKQDNRLIYGLPKGDAFVVGSVSWEETESGLKQLALVLAGLWLPLTILTAAVAWYGGGLVLRPVSELVQSAGKLSSSASEDLLETTDHAEFAQLARSLNDLITRVRQSAQVQEQFASDAAHELRSPLSILRARVEVTLLSQRSADQYQESLQSMLGSIDRLTSIIETLLASACEERDEGATVDLALSTAEVIEDWRINAGWSESQMDVQLETCQATIGVDELRIVLRNLLDNAARHAPVDTSIEIRLTAKDSICELTIRDFGKGLSADEQTRAFDRLYRTDVARNRSEGGTGIGLALVRRIIESRGGRVSFQPAATGAIVLVNLPQSN